MSQDLEIDLKIQPDMFFCGPDLTIGIKNTQESLHTNPVQFPATVLKSEDFVTPAPHCQG